MLWKFSINRVVELSLKQLYFLGLQLRKIFFGTCKLDKFILCLFQVFSIHRWYMYLFLGSFRRYICAITGSIEVAECCCIGVNNFDQYDWFNLVFESLLHCVLLFWCIVCAHHFFYTNCAWHTSNWILCIFIGSLKIYVHVQLYLHIHNKR